MENNKKLESCTKNNCTWHVFLVVVIWNLILIGM